ncbi:MAG: hypothetical protein HOW73_12410, partial [Polyangiaceae bacterium]|nr:hypothetical protein [Polyangiaceae bacterium]
TLGLRHQDIKPENIFLARFGGRLHPVLLDLGVAAEKDSTFVAGTALYAAPEQLTAILGLDKETPLSEKMDTYCIGATLLLALVGDKLFPGSKALTRRQVIESHAVRSTKPLADDALLDVSENIRTELDKRLAKWMSLEPVDRPNMSQVAEELEILLEPEREAERAEENARNRQKRALARARVAASIVLLIGIGVGALALWKRETLRLAGELEEARAQGAENFEELDTCVAAHAVTSKEMKTCKTDLADEQTEHEKTLNALSKQGEGCSEAVDQMKDLRTKMQAEKKKHDDELKAQDKECTTEKDKLTTDLGGERDKFKTERDTCESSLKEKETEMTTLRQERDTCVASNGSGTNAGNTNASATSTSDPYADPPPSATVVPSAPPSGAPSTAPLPPPTTPPTTTPPPPPPPAPPPPAPAPTAGQTAPGSQSSDATPGSTPPSMQQPLTD